MGKTLFAAIVAAILASVATTILLGSFESPEQRATAARIEKQEREIDTLHEIMQTLERRQNTQRRESRGSKPSHSAGSAPWTGPGSGSGSPDGESPVAPDGTPYVSRADLETYFAEQAETLRPKQPEFVAPEPVEKKTLEEVAAEMGLSIGEEAQLRIIQRETEEEMLQIFFGDRSMEEIETALEEAAEDPDKQAAMIQEVLPRMFGNAGPLLTMRARHKKRIEAILGKERTEEFMRENIESPNGEFIEELFENL